MPGSMVPCTVGSRIAFWYLSIWYISYNRCWTRSLQHRVSTWLQNTGTDPRQRGMGRSEQQLYSRWVKGLSRHWSSAYLALLHSDFPWHHTLSLLHFCEIGRMRDSFRWLGLDQW
jgi:hypothetical protein